MLASLISPAQQPAPPASTTNAAPSAPTTPAAKPVRSSDRRKAAKLYLASGKLFEKEQFEEAMRGYEQAAALDPGDADYPLAAGVARGHAVTVLLQAAARDRMRQDEPAARAALAHALELDPQNAQITQHLNQLGDDALSSQQRPIYAQAESTLGEEPLLVPAAGLRTFRLHTDQREILRQVFKTYGIDATIDDSVRGAQVRLDIDDATFASAVRSAELVTGSFYVPLDAHRVLVARDTKENRDQFIPLEYETIYLSGLSKTELDDVGNLAKNLFDVRESSIDAGTGTFSLRAPRRTLDAFNATMSEMLEGHSQVLLQVHMIQLAHNSERDTGVHLPQTTSALNVYTEEQSILNANQALVQQIITSGLAAPGDTLTILGILLASGQVSNSLLTNGVALFGGGLTASAVTLGSISANVNLNSSESRELDEIQLRLGDGEDATLKNGIKYPIQTSSYSAGIGSVPTIPGLTGAGSSSSLSSLYSSYANSVPNIPQVQYQDLGMTLKATPRILRGGDVALKIDMKIDALAGSSNDGNPILSNRAYSGVVTIKQGEAVEIVSELDKTESRALSGTPGLSEIPGMNSLSGNDLQKNYATLLIIFTTRVVRGAQAAGHSPMMRIERGPLAR